MDYSAKDYHAIKHVEGVIRFLGSPTPLPDDEAEIMKWLFNDGKIIEPSYALIDKNDNLVEFEGFLKGYENKITFFNRRQRKARIDVKFGGHTHKANLAFELKWADEEKNDRQDERG